jgi:hypothetical protein
MRILIIRELYSDILHINNNPMACIQYIFHDNNYMDVYFNKFFEDIPECILFYNIIYLQTHDIDKVIDCIHNTIVDKYCPFLPYNKDFIKDDAWHFQESEKYNGQIEKFEDTYKFIIS